jgi:hypothetical protein
MAAVLAVLIATTGATGAVVALVQRPPIATAPPSTPTPTPYPFRTGAPTPVPGGPVLGVGFSMASDPAIRRVVVFGGIDSYDTTWLWDGTHWSLARRSVSPPGRYGAAAAYDPATRLVMLFGGRLAPGDIANDTWAWNGTAWSEINAGTGGPPPGEGAVMGWDGALSQMVLVTFAAAGITSGSETWVWAGSHWARQPAGALSPGAFGIGMWFDPASQKLLFVTEPPAGAGTSTWEWSGSSWHELRARVAAVPIGVALDPSSGRLVLCGIPLGALWAQLWRWTGINWTSVPGSRVPIQPEAAVGDTDRGRLIIFGWLSQPNQGSPQPLEVWWWSPQGWQQLDGTTR